MSCFATSIPFRSPLVEPCRILTALFAFLFCRLLPPRRNPEAPPLDLTWHSHGRARSRRYPGGPRPDSKPHSPDPHPHLQRHKRNSWQRLAFQVRNVSKNGRLQNPRSIERSHGPAVARSEPPNCGHAFVWKSRPGPHCPCRSACTCARQSISTAIFVCAGGQHGMVSGC